MKRRTNRIPALLAIVAICAMLVTGCGTAKVKAGDYSGSVAITHPLEVEIPAFGPDAAKGPTKQTIEKWGADVAITVDEEGTIWNVVAKSPEGVTMSTNPMQWTVFGGKFLSSITGIYTCKDIMAIKVDTEGDGFPVLKGDCSGIHLADKAMTLINNQESTCALIILAIQNAITANGLN